MEGMIAVVFFYGDYMNHDTRDRQVIANTQVRSTSSAIIAMGSIFFILLTLCFMWR